jgi:hypothetical protein
MPMLGQRNCQGIIDHLKTFAHHSFAAVPYAGTRLMCPGYFVALA